MSANGAPGGHPLVTVVTPCHDAEAFVAETIESVLAQDWPAVEHVIVDDASTDGSWAVVEAYAARFPDRVRALRLAGNRGGSHARNRGAELARGEFLMFLDADDVISPDTLSALVEAVRDRPGSIGACACMELRRGPDGRWAEVPREMPVPDSDTDLYRALLELTAWAPTCSVLWRRDVYDRTGGWDETMARDQDTDIMIRAYSGGARLVRAAGGTGFYRIFEGSRSSVSSGVSEARFRSSVRILDLMRRELERLGKLPEYAETLSRSYHLAAMHGFQQGFPELARECLRCGKALTGRRIVSSTSAGRVLESVLGLEGKERLVLAFARLGVTTRTRRRELHMHQAVRKAEIHP